MKWTVEAISNIIENAIKYTDQDGKIKISVIPYQSFTAIEIKDNGMGIAEEEQASVFLRFFRSEKVNDKKGSGAGIISCQRDHYQTGRLYQPSVRGGKGFLFPRFPF